MRLKLERRPLAGVIPYSNNTKVHNDADIDLIVASVERFGFNDPIGVDDDNNIIEGHGRFEAAKKIGLAEVPVLVITGLTEQERRAYAVAHNQTTLNTGMDRNAVRAEFDELNVQPDDYMAIGYTNDDVLFLSQAFDPQHNTGTDHNGHASNSMTGFFPTVVKTVIEFDTEDQFDKFQDFQIALRQQYPDGDTIADRLMLFVAEYGGQFHGY
jgi:hypothetical protein